MPSGCRLRERKSHFIQLLYPKPPRQICPNMYVLAHANGCLFTPQCNYCYLKSSFGHLKEHEAFTNLDQMTQEIRRWIARDDLQTYVLNAGTMSDSFTFEGVRPAAARLVELFRQEARGRRHTLLFVTKGGPRECQPLYDVEPCENVIVSFSVNHPEVARRFEKGAAPVADRFQAASDLKERGWRLRMRIDPMFVGYDYRPVAETVKTLAPETVTLGSLRADPDLYRFVEEGLFDDLDPPTEDGFSAHYPLEVRVALYKQAVDVLKEVCPIALCDENAAAWDVLGLDKEARPCNCHV